MRINWIIYTLLLGMQNGAATPETLRQFLYYDSFYMLLPYNPTIVPLGIYPSEMKTYVHTRTCTQMFVAALFITSKH